MRPEAIKAMRPYLSEIFGNASSRHAAGREAWTALEQARDQVAAWVDANPDEVIFTSGATEANFLALQGRFEALLEEGRETQSIRVAASAIEHPCVRACIERLRRRGAETQIVPVTKQGIIDLSFFDRDPNWDIVSVMAVNHETGAIQPIQELSQRLDSTRVFLHCDAAQWASRCEGGFQMWGVGAASVSAHKIGGPKGIGALVIRNNIELTPIFPGSQEVGLRGGTVNVPGAVGFGAAAEALMRNQEDERLRQHTLRERLWRGVENADSGPIRTIPAEKAAVNTLHVRFPGHKGERIVDGLDRRGICCSSGPACASGASEASPVLLAMGYSEKQSWEGVRFSVGTQTTVAEIDAAIDCILANR